MKKPTIDQKASAVLFLGPGQPLRLETFDPPRLKPGEVLVRVTYGTLCGSDLHTFTGRRSTPCPTILGHEIMGEIAQFPSGDPIRDAAGSPLRIGERVTWAIAVSCGACFFCNHGLPQKCEKLFKYGHEKITKDHPLNGGLAQYCHLARGTAIYRVPDELTEKVACPANCATATAAAALRFSGDCAGRTVLVQGAGMLGLSAAAMARDRGATEVIVCDLDADRLALAESFGATRSVVVGEGSDELQEAVAQATEGRGVDTALEMTGAPSAVEMGVDLLRIGGIYIWVGGVFPVRPPSITEERVVRKMLTIRGLHNYAPEDLETALDFLRRRHDHHPFEALVSAEFPLEQAEEAFQYASANRVHRVAVRCV